MLQSASKKHQEELLLAIYESREELKAHYIGKKVYFKIAKLFPQMEKKFRRR